MDEDRPATEPGASDPLRDDDGERLLFTEEVAELLGVTVATVRWKNSAAKRARRQHRRGGFPPPRKHVRRTTIKSNGQPVTTMTPVWREERVLAYRRNRLGPGGRPVNPAVRPADRGQEAG